MERKTIFVSIVVPVYGVEKYVKRCLESIDSQSYPDLEVIIVNDCTKDRSMEVIDSFIKNESRHPAIYKVVNHKKNKGLSEARNTGIKEAKGDFIYFLDSDDYISHDCINGMADCIRRFDVDIVFGNITRIRKKENFYQPFDSTNRIYEREEILSLYTKGLLYREACNKMVRKRYLVNNDLFFIPGMLNEDVNWSFRLLAHPFKAALCDKPTYFYIQEREGSIMATITLKNYEASIKNLDIINRVIEQQHLVDDVPYIRYYVSMIDFTIWFLFFHKNKMSERKMLYYKFRENRINYGMYYKICGIKRSFKNLHIRIQNTRYAYWVFEIYNTWRRMKGRISNG